LNVTPPRRSRDEYQNPGSKVGGFLFHWFLRLPMKVRVWGATALATALLGAGGSAATGITPMQLLRAPGLILDRLDHIDQNQRALYANQVTTMRIVAKIPGYDSAENAVLEENRDARRRAKRKREIYGDPLVDPNETPLTPFDPSKGMDITVRNPTYGNR
jgi:hypothetical protein